MRSLVASSLRAAEQVVLAHLQRGLRRALISSAVPSAHAQGAVEAVPLLPAAAALSHSAYGTSSSMRGLGRERWDMQGLTRSQGCCAKHPLSMPPSRLQTGPAPGLHKSQALWKLFKGPHR